MGIIKFFTTIGMDEQPGEYFFGFHHLVYIALSIILFILLFVFLSKQTKKTQDKYITGFLILIILLKLAGEAVFIYEYYFVEEAYSTYPHKLLDINTIFSFQLCGIMNMVLPFVFWFKIKPLKEFVFTTSILGGFSVMLYPVTVLYGDPFAFTLPMIRSVIVHFFLIFIPLFLIYRGDFKLKKERWYLIALGLLGAASWAMFGNLVIDTSANNMYLMTNPFLDGPIPILNILPNGYHVIFLTFAVTIGYFLVYQIVFLFQNKSIMIEKI